MFIRHSPVREGSQEEVSVGQESQAVHIWETEAKLLVFVHTSQSSSHSRARVFVHTLNIPSHTRGRLCHPPSLTSGRRLCHFLQSGALIGFLIWLCLCQTITHSFHPLFTRSLKASSVLNKEDLGRKPTLPSHLNTTILYLRTYKLHRTQPWWSALFFFLCSYTFSTHSVCNTLPFVSEKSTGNIRP